MWRLPGVSRFQIAVILILTIIVTSWLTYKHWETSQLLYLQMAVKSPVTSYAQVFYDIGSNLNEKDSVCVNIIAGDEFSILRFRLSKKPIRALRFDPLDTSGHLAVKDAQIINGRGKLVQQIQVEAFQPLSQIKRMKIEDNTLLIETEERANDPMIYLQVTYPIIVPRHTRVMLFYIVPVFVSTVALIWWVLKLQHDPFVQNQLTRIRGEQIRHVIVQTTAILLIALILGEISFRIYNYFNPVSIFYSDSYNRFRGKPHDTDYDFMLNSHGFKDLEITEKKAHAFRILGIGDSFAYGVVPYEYNYLTLLESQLQQEHLSVEVLNMGIPGMGPPDYLALLVHEGLTLAPDMVLVSFFIGNDFIESNRSQQRPIYTYSHVFSLFHYLFTIKLNHGGRMYGQTTTYCDECPFFDPTTFLQLEKERSFIYLKENDQFEKLLGEALDYLQQIQHICKKKRLELVIILIPDEIQLNYTLQAEIKKTFYPYLETDQWDITLPNQKLTERLNTLGITNIDLYEDFAENPQQPLYRPRDTHWNIAGNKLAATIIQNELQKILTEKF